MSSKKITELNSKLIQHFSKNKKNIEKLEKLAKKKQSQIEHNRKNGYKIRSLRKEFTKGKISISKFDKEIKFLNKTKFDLKIINNDIKRASGGDHIITIEDSFRTIKIKLSSLLSKKDPSVYILKKKLKAVEDDLKKEKNGQKRPKVIRGIEIQLQRTKNNISMLLGEEIEDEDDMEGSEGKPIEYFMYDDYIDLI